MLHVTASQGLTLNKNAKPWSEQLENFYKKQNPQKNKADLEKYSKQAFIDRLNKKRAPLK